MKPNPGTRFGATALVGLLALTLSVPLAAAHHAASLDFRLTGSPGSVLTGQQVSYTATVSNDGPGAIANAAFQDQLPGKATLGTVTTSQGSCTNGPPVECNLGGLADGQSATITINVTANDPGLMINRGWVSSNPPGNWRHERLVITHVHAQTASLDFRLTGSPGSVLTGQQVSYTATVSNDGPGAIANAAFQDQLPGKATLGTVTTSQGSCTNGPPVECNLGGLADGQSATITINVTANDPGLMINRGWVSSNPPGNWRHERLVITHVHAQTASLDFRLTGSPGSVLTGQQVSYTATVSNDGPGAIANAAFQDQLPGKATLGTVTTSQGSCTNGPPVECNLGGLADGQSATITINVTANDPGLMINRGWVSSNPPGNWRHERLVITHVHAQTASLDFRLTGSPGSVLTGQQVSYTATVSNDGPGAIANAAFQDQLPGKATLGTVTTSQGSCTNGPPVECNLGGLADGQSATITINVTANDPGLMINRGWVSSNPPGNWRHERLVITHVHAQTASLDFRLTGSPGSVLTGQQVSYTATVSNDGPGAIANAAFQDQLPGKATLGTVTTSQGSCTNGPPVECNLGGLADGQSATITINVTANDPGLMINRGWVSSNPPGNWRHERLVITHVHAQTASLDFRLTGSPGSVLTGQQVSYTATVSNDGPGAIANAAFQDQLPGKATLGTVTTSQGSCTNGPPVECNLGGLADGQSATITINVTANDPGLMINRGWVSSNPPGNWRHERLVITHVHAQTASLDFRLTGSPGSVLTGQQVSYTATVSNDGPGAIANAAFQDQLPGKATLGTVTTSQGSCTNGPPVECNLGGLADGQSATITINVTANDPGLMINRGWVSSNPPGNWRHERLVITSVKRSHATITTTATTTTAHTTGTTTTGTTTTGTTTTGTTTTGTTTTGTTTTGTTTTGTTTTGTTTTNH